MAPPPAIRKRKARTAPGGGPPAYASYLRKLLDQIYPAPDKIGISSVGMDAVNGIVLDLQDRLVEQAAKLARYQKKQTLSARHVQTACSLVMPPDLAKHAMKDGVAAANKYTARVLADAKSAKK